MIHDTAEKLLLPLRQRYRATPLPAFFSWWGRELGALFPDRWRRRLMPPKPQLWLVPASSGGDLRVWRMDGEPRVLDVFGAGEDVRLLETRWRELIAEFTDGKPEVRLCLNEEDYLALPIELPSAVQDNLHQALYYQIDQVSPFQPDQVLFDQRVARQFPEHGRIEAELRMVRREVVEPLLERLHAIGLVVHVVDTVQETDPPAAEGFNLLPEDRRPGYVHARARFNAMLAVVLVVLVGAVMAETLILRERTLAQLTDEARVLREEAGEVGALRLELQESLAAASFLAEKRASEATMIEVLDEVTRVLPDDIWLQQFQIQAGELRIQGMTEGSQRVVGLLNESPMLESPEITGNISIDPMTGKERFRTQAQVAAGPVDDAAADGGES